MCIYNSGITEVNGSVKECRLSLALACGPVRFRVILSAVAHHLWPQVSARQITKEKNRYFCPSRSGASSVPSHNHGMTSMPCKDNPMNKI